ncbi:MAG: aminotransferase class V-fold PLP-dependent enzyme [Planctomycetota bacterium]
MRAEDFTLDPELCFLNHGSFGAVPRSVQAFRTERLAALERDPIRYLAPERELEPKLDAVRARTADLLGCGASDLAFVRNATDGVNAVLQSMTTAAGAARPLAEGENIVVTDHGYNACTNAARFAAERVGADVRVARIPFPIESPAQALAAIQDACDDWTRLLLVDSVTSPTALVLPMEEIVAFARERGIRVLVDAAHAPGMLDVDLDALGADYATGNFHKWVCGPKVSGFLHVAPEHQESVRPTTISHAANTPRPQRSRFLAEFDWTGTFDVTALEGVSAALDFLEAQDPDGLAGVRRRNRALALEARDLLIDVLGIEAPAPDSMLGSMATVPLPAGPAPEPGGVDPLQAKLYDAYRIEVPIWQVPDGRRLLRVSAQLYNERADYERLCDALARELELARS